MQSTSKIYLHFATSLSVTSADYYVALSLPASYSSPADNNLLFGYGEEHKKEKKSFCIMILRPALYIAVVFRDFSFFCSFSFISFSSWFMCVEDVKSISILEQTETFEKSRGGKATWRRSNFVLMKGKFEFAIFIKKIRSSAFSIKQLIFCCNEHLSYPLFSCKVMETCRVRQQNVSNYSELT